MHGKWLEIKYTNGANGRENYFYYIGNKRLQNERKFLSWIDMLVGIPVKEKANRGDIEEVASGVHKKIDVIFIIIFFLKNVYCCT